MFYGYINLQNIMKYGIINIMVNTMLKPIKILSQGGKNYDKSV